MIPGDMFAVLLVLAVCVPILIMLIHLQLNEKRLLALERENSELRAEIGEWMGLPRKLLESGLKADLVPTEEEVSVKNG